MQTTYNLDLSILVCTSVFFFFSSRRRHTRSDRDWSSDVCSSDLGRRSCADCGRVFNLLTSPPASSESCPRTGAPHRLMQRPDDNEATVAERLRVYDEKTRPLIDFYRARGLLRVIDAAGDVDEVTRRQIGRAHV